MSSTAKQFMYSHPLVTATTSHYNALEILIGSASLRNKQFSPLALKLFSCNATKIVVV